MHRYDFFEKICFLASKAFFFAKLTNAIFFKFLSSRKSRSNSVSNEGEGATENAQFRKTSFNASDEAREIKGTPSFSAALLILNPTVDLRAVKVTQDKTKLNIHTEAVPIN